MKYAAFILSMLAMAVLLCGGAAAEGLDMNEKLTLSIDGVQVEVDWEENESVAALRELVQSNPLTIRMSMYGRFEQVGPLGTSLP